MPKDNNTINNGSQFQRKIGKDTYSLFDVDNMRQANKELEKQMQYYERRAEALRKELKLQKEIDKLNDKEKREREAKQRDLDFYASKLDSINNKLVKNDDVMKNWNKHIRGTFINPANSTQNANDIIGIVQSNNQHPKNFQDILNKSFQTKVNDAYKKVAANTYNKYKRQGADFTDSKVVNKMYAEAQEKTATKVDGMYKKYNTATSILKVAADTFNKAVNTWVSVAKAGLENQTSAYENTFENISVRNGISRKNYYDAQWRINNTLGDMGLYNNVAASDVQNMWNTMASAGVNIDMSTEKARADLTANAIDLVLTNKIVPYLDTSSQEFLILNSRLDNNFVKDIRGINKANLEIAGNNYVTQDLLQTIIDQVQPMSDEALENLAQGSTEVTSMINSLIAQDYSPDAAKAYATQLFKTQRYSDQIMRSGSLTERMALIDSMGSGINIYDPTHWNDYIGTAVNEDQMIASWTNGYTGTTQGVVTNMVGNSTGVGYDRMWGALNLNSKGLTGTDLTNNSNLSQEEIQSLANDKTNEYSDDKNQTNKTLQNITMENFMTELSVINEWLGNWATVIESAIKGIGSLITVYLGGKFLGSLTNGKIGSWLSGLFTSGKTTAAATGKLTGASGIVAAAGGVALGIGAANVIKGAIETARSKTDEKNISAEASALQGTALEGNTAAETLGGITTTTQADNNNFGTNLGAAWNTTTRWIGVGTLGWTRNLSDINQDDFNFFREKIQTLGGGPTKSGAKDALLIWTLLLASANRLSDVAELANITNADLKEMVEESGIAPSAWDAYLNDTIKDIGYLPNKTNKEDQTSIDWEKLGIEYHRQGLDYVPYDNYPAMLHEGEAVLTATTANTLRDLLSEYQASNNQAVNYDSALQTQTNSLVAKLDELITVVANNGGSLFTTSEDTKKAQSILNNSMRHMTSTKDF